MWLSLDWDASGATDIRQVQGVPQTTLCISRTETTTHIFWSPKTSPLPATFCLLPLRCPLTPWYSKRPYRNQYEDFSLPFSELRIAFRWRVFQGRNFWIKAFAHSCSCPPLFPSVSIFFLSPFLSLSNLTTLYFPALSKMLPQTFENLFVWFF